MNDKNHFRITDKFTLKLIFRFSIWLYERFLL